MCVGDFTLRRETELSHEEVKPRAARAALSGFTRHAVVRIMALVGTLLLARMIAPAGFGLFATSQFLLSGLSALCVGGVIAALVRRREALSEGDLRTAFTVQQTLAVLVLIVVWFVAPQIVLAYHLKPHDVWVIRAMSAIVLVMSLKSIPNAVLQRQVRHDLVAASEVAEYLIYLVTALLLAWLKWGVWALVTATAVRHITGMIILHLSARMVPHWGLDRAKAGQLLKFAVPLQATGLVDLATRAAAPLAAGLLFSVATVGVIGMANTMLDAVILQPIVLLSALQLRLFARNQDSQDATRRLMAQSIYVGAAAVSPFAVFLASLAPVIIGLLLPGSWQQVGPLIQGLFLSCIIQVVASPISQASKALGMVGTSLGASVVNLILQLSVLFALEPYLGLTAYPIAATVGAVAYTLVLWVRVGRRIGGAPVGAILPVVVASLGAGAIWWLAGVSHNLPIALAGLVLGGLVYVLLLMLLSGKEMARYLRILGDATLAKKPALLAKSAKLAALVDRAQIFGRGPKGSPS